jgi:Mg-chelatase subunit ChlD
VNFASEEVPISIGVILDLSGSMANKLGKAKEAAFQFFKIANPQDEFFLVGFNERAQLLSPFTNKVEDLQSRMLPASAKGKTALLDAMHCACDGGIALTVIPKPRIVVSKCIGFDPRLECHAGVMRIAINWARFD